MLANDIVNAISSALTENFDNVEVYIDEIEQGFNDPCFFIDLLNPSEKQIYGDRYFRRYLFDVQFFPTNEKKSRQIRDTLDKLHNVLEYIKLENGDLLRGYNRKAEEQNGILHYFASYNMFVNKVKVKEKEARMETLSTDTKIKETEE